MADKPMPSQAPVDTGAASGDIAARVAELVQQMGLDEKIGQMSQLQSAGGHVPEHLADAIRRGEVGSILNEVDVETVNALQRIAVEESRLGIPLIFGRDVIHGFKTIFPIPLGQAASWNPALVEEAARVSAAEAAGYGVHWTFAPMIDVARDPRWGRIAESPGEDPYLGEVMGVAMVRGFQGHSLHETGSIAACAKHFAAYGAAESGRDYNTSNVPENELRNVYLRPFRAAAEAGVATFMTAFCELDGVPASGNRWLLDTVLRQEWRYEGMVVSDWESVVEMSVHGFTHDDAGSAYAAVSAGVDMEMASSSYRDHVEGMVNEGRIEPAHIDRMVARILTLKFELGLFDKPYTDPAEHAEPLNRQHLKVAKELAMQSCVLLKNRDQTLPLSSARLQSIAVIGPLADDGYEQMGTWVFDGEAEHSVTCVQALRELIGRTVEIHHLPVLPTTRAPSSDGFSEVRQVASEVDANVLVLGEESFMSGEAHSRASLDLPGHQLELIKAVRECGKPLILVVMAGRPLTLEPILPLVDALLYAWHPGSMGGPAIADLLLGLESPSGKLPVTFPRAVGQVPIYYAHKNTGRPPTDGTCVHIDDVPPKAPQTSLGMASFHLDTGFRPLFPFGFGLSYADFKYVKITTSRHQVHIGESIDISADLLNTGNYEAEEVAQLYLRDLVGSITRPVRELKGFQRIRLRPGERRRITFRLHSDDLAFYDRSAAAKVEAGHFHAWIGGNADASLQTEFELLPPRDS
ncbi:MAG: beta-glucosidase BglX [Halieaceae bacterium]|nr:beta-glucosidase BglX [Halieaceae bacterium]